MSNDKTLQFYAHGKLLLTGEYAVLDGATALAIPTRYGQSMSVHSTQEKGCIWKSYDVHGNLWFETTFSPKGTFVNSDHSQNEIAKTLQQILYAAKKLNPLFDPFSHYEVEMRLEFARDWGLGSSSTLLYTIAQWAEVDAVTLLRSSFGGSGYDVAVAEYKKPLLYQLVNGQSEIKTVTLPWNFKDQLFFVHLNDKQSSKEGIATYKKALRARKAPLEHITRLTHEIVNCTHLTPCKALFDEHEAIISELLNVATIRSRLFSDYDGIVKSLGAWGGDFILASGGLQEKKYFRERGYSTIISFSEMIA